MPRVRTRASTAAAIAVSSDEEEDTQPAPARPKRRRGRNSSSRSGAVTKNVPKAVPPRASRATTSLSSRCTPAKRRKTEETEVVNAAGPSKCTRSARRSSASPLEMPQKPEDQAKKQFSMLLDKYGAECDGFGVRLVQDKSLNVAYVAVVPKCSSRSFTAVFLSKRGPTEMRNLKYFPPLRVRIEASSSSTRFAVVGTWLQNNHLKSLSKELNKVFRTLKGEFPICAAVDWLESKGVEESSGSMFHRTLYYAAPDVVRKEPFHIVFEDIRAVQQMFVQISDTIQTVIKCAALRGKTAFDCSICFEHRPILSAVVFPCSHTFCSDCVRQDLTIKVRENRVQEMVCPSDQCLHKAPTDLVKRLLDPETFKQYCTHCSEAIASPSSVRCPQKNCSAVMAIGPDTPRDLQCSSCRHKFCSLCRAKPHPKKPCLTDEAKREIRERYKKGDARARREVEQRYGADNVKFALQDAESEEWISKNAKPCPKCKTPIQKTDGCNKMMCTAKGCRTSFCYLCGLELPGNNPYAHFQNGACSGRLHEGNNMVGAAPPPIDMLDLWDDADALDEDMFFDPLYLGPEMYPDMFDTDSDDDDMFFGHQFFQYGPYDPYDDAGDWSDSDDDGWADDFDDDDSSTEDDEA